MTLRPHAAFASACGGDECATRTFCILGNLRLVRPGAGSCRPHGDGGTPAPTQTGS